MENNWFRNFDGARPCGYEIMEESWKFDPSRHLSLEFPERIFSLEELGYTKDQISACPSSLAITTPFRMLSPEGVKALLGVARQLEAFSTSTARIPKMVRGGVYRSRFLHDLCCSPVLAEFMSELAQVKLMPHTMPLQLGHINYQSNNILQAADKWHWDGVGFDYVVMPSDPKLLDGGNFVWFKGTKQDGAILLEDHGDITDQRRMEFSFPEAGFAIFQQGNMVLHRVKKLNVLAERITVVNSFVASDGVYEDVSRYKDMQEADPPGLLYSEWARHKAWLSKRKIENLLEQLPYSTDKELIVARLKGTIEDVLAAIEDISGPSSGKGIYFGD